MNRSNCSSPMRSSSKDTTPKRPNRKTLSKMMHQSEPSISFDEFGFCSPLKLPSGNNMNEAVPSDDDSSVVALADAAPEKKNRRQGRRSPGPLRRSGHNRSQGPRNSSSLKRLSSSAIVVVENLMDSSNDSSSSTQKAQMRKESFRKIQRELKKGPSMPDIVARLQTLTQGPSSDGLDASLQLRDLRRSTRKTAAAKNTANEDASFTVSWPTVVSDHSATSDASFAFDASDNLKSEHKKKNADSITSMDTGSWSCNCGSILSDRMSFCGFCGSKKHWSCSDMSCQFDENLPSFRFCGGCGTARGKCELR